MSAAVRIPVMQGSEAWLEARRQGITATMIGAILGVSPWSCEADVAAERRGERVIEPSIRMRVGSHMEPLIAQLYAEQTGGPAPRRVRAMYRHPEIPWAMCSPDFRVGGLLVEVKKSDSASRWADGLPQDYEAQCRWTLGVMGEPRMDLAALVGDRLLVFPVEHQEPVWLDMVAAAEDYLRREAAGGPLAQSGDSASRTWPRDDGSEIRATPDDEALALRLHDAKKALAAAKAESEALESALKARIGEHSALAGNGWRITWKRSKDSASTDWAALAADLMAPMAETDRSAAVGRFTTAQEGKRYFRPTWGKEEQA